MLQLKNIKKDYTTVGETVHALKGIDLEFRESEFVSILGPSGCGKTTMLNIIGGLDQYTDGDLIINGRSTKEYHDRDWDAYRNHSIGFVFQSYNLIPHQSVLQNVELALTLSGVKRAERKRRARKALEAVGLGDQLNKRPTEMSGGQMQRVAIARALVNDPDIILADEPTGALDTETSIQVLDILHEVAKDRLVIMVTHNAELAERYSSRIIRMLDGKIIGDSMPISERENVHVKKTAAQSGKRPSMGMFTSFALSLKNLFTKKGRTLLTSFAGSIGIIGIALIFAVSEGMTTYIDTLQEDTLSSYPLTLEAQHLSLSSLMETFMGSAISVEEHELDAVYQKGMLYEMMNALNSMEAEENDLEAFKDFVERQIAYPDSRLASALSGVQYSYDIELEVYTKNVDGEIIRSDSESMLRQILAEYFGTDIGSVMGDTMSSMASMSPMAGAIQLWQEMLPATDGGLISPLLEKQYDVIYGRWPAAYNEIVLVVDENNEIDDMTLYALGLSSKEDVDALAEAALNRTQLDASRESWSYADICGMKFRVVFPSNCYTYDMATGCYTDLRETQTGLKYLYDSGIDLKVTGIIRPNEDAVSTMLTGTIGYTSALTEYVIENSKHAPSVNAQLNDPDTDIFTNLPFKASTGSMSDAEKIAEFDKYIAGLDTQGKAAAYVKIMSIPAEEEIAAQVEQIMAAYTREDMEATLLEAMSAQMGMDMSEIELYVGSMGDEDITELFDQMLTEQMRAQYAAEVQRQLGTRSAEELAALLDMNLAAYSDEQRVVYHDEVLDFSASDYDSNLKKLGVVELSSPSAINLYASSFENKDLIEEVIADYNEDVGELEKISYTDYVGLMMSSITTIINAISYVLIAFVAISLIVSSIMIGVITLISVQERTKEIGILRALGASKRNVSRLFNAETVILGFAAGLFGVVVTYLLCIPINLILHRLTGIPNLNAIFPLPAALILIGISVLLTLFAGIIPSRSAAKKDPVVALRTE